MVDKALGCLQFAQQSKSGERNSRNTQSCSQTSSKACSETCSEAQAGGQTLSGVH
ncbi:hypothetical protein sync_1306 [Synechococcus sp. CC9311]|nr:hypothetical protein sync_1306 [Synechococcus sp. CC9311]